MDITFGLGIRKVANRTVIYEAFLSIADNGDILLVDMGYKKPISVISKEGLLMYRFGERGNGPGQIGSIRDIIAPANGNDSTYVIEFDKRAIFVYVDSVFVRQYSIPGDGYPRFASRINDNNIMLGYVNSNTQAREIELTSGRWVDSSNLYTFPESFYPELPQGGEMDFFKGYALKYSRESDVYLFSMNTDVLQIFSNGKRIGLLSGLTDYRPDFSDGKSFKPVNKFRAFGRPLRFCDEKAIVSYSGEHRDSKHKQYYQSSSLLIFDHLEEKFTSRLIIEPALRWNYGAIDCGKEVIYLVDQNFDREGASIYKLEFSSSPFFE